MRTMFLVLGVWLTCSGAAFGAQDDGRRPASPTDLDFLEGKWAATEELRWSVGAATIVGRLDLPDGEGPFPAVVFAPGSGSIGRSHVTAAAHAERLSRAGIAVLTFDKRGVGESSGDWRRETFADYAADVEGGIASLKQHRRIDPTRLGLIGHSQGGWTAPLAAQRAGGVAFIVLLSATPFSPLEQSLHVEEAEMTSRRMPPDQQREALDLLRAIFTVYRTNAGWDDAQRAIDAARSRPWFDPKRFAVQSKDSWNWQWLHALPFDFDVAPVLSTLNVPMLTVNGALDRLVPAEASRARFQEIRRTAGLPITAVVLEGLHHGLGATERAQPADPYWDLLLRWLGEIKVRSDSAPGSRN